jgi:hypothetical protein
MSSSAAQPERTPQQALVNRSDAQAKPARNSRGCSPGWQQRARCLVASLTARGSMARSLTGACQCRADKALRYSMPIRIDDLRSCFPTGYQSRRLSDQCWLEFQHAPWRFPRDRASRSGVRSRNVFGAPRIPEWGRSVHARLESKEDTRVRRYRVEHEFPHEQTRFVALLVIHLPQAAWQVLMCSAHVRRLRWQSLQRQVRTEEASGGAL